MRGTRRRFRPIPGPYWRVTVIEMGRGGRERTFHFACNTYLPTGPRDAAQKAMMKAYPGLAWMLRPGPYLDEGPYAFKVGTLDRKKLLYPCVVVELAMVRKSELPWNK